MHFLGTPPIAPLAYMLGKVAVAACWASLVARSIWAGVVWVRSPALDVLGAGLLVAGVLVLVAGLANLGGSLRMGIPQDETALKTGGIYRYTRNPIYVGGLLTCLAAVAWTLNPIVAAFALLAAGVHHQIVLAEERFLATRFGDAWTQYAAKVRRYL